MQICIYTPISFIFCFWLQSTLSYAVLRFQFGLCNNKKLGFSFYYPKFSASRFLPSSSLVSAFCIGFLLTDCPCPEQFRSPHGFALMRSSWTRGFQLPYRESRIPSVFSLRLLLLFVYLRFYSDSSRKALVLTFLGFCHGKEWVVPAILVLDA